MAPQLLTTWPTTQNTILDQCAVTLLLSTLRTILQKVAALPDSNLAQAHPHDDDHLPSISMTNWRRYSTGTGGGGCDIVTCTVWWW